MLHVVDTLATLTLATLTVVPTQLLAPPFLKVNFQKWTRYPGSQYYWPTSCACRCASACYLRSVNPSDR